MPPAPGDLIPIPIGSKPGIQRDGTRFDSDSYVDGEWMRFQRGRPRKMRGYKLATDFLDGISRGLFATQRAGITYASSGSANNLESFNMNTDGGVLALPTTRTPGGFVADPNNNWQFDAMFNAGGAGMALIAHAAPNLQFIDNDVDTDVWYGDIYANTALVTTTQSVSGGVAVIPPFLFIFGTDGNISWSDENQPTVWGSGASGSARITSAKIVRGMPTRGGAGFSPSGLFWSLDSLIRAYFIGGAAVFAFDVISDQISVLSSSAFVEFDGLFFWPGVDRFLVYNGTVREVPNNMNINFFFDNLNYQYRQKVFAVKIPRWGEIWFCAPLFGATECNWAVIYNVRENVWYDTPLPDGGRSAAFYAQTIQYPMFARAANTVNGWPVWLHEIGLNRVEGTLSTAIRSSFETGTMSRVAVPPPSNNAIHVSHLELDFVQRGQMKATLIGSVNPRSPVIRTDQYFEPEDELTYFKAERRNLRFRFESFEDQGDYELGKCVAHVKDGTGRIKA